MKKLIILILTLSSITASAQTWTDQYLGSKRTLIKQRGWMANDSGMGLPMDTMTAPASLASYRWLAVKDSTLWMWNGTKYIRPIGKVPTFQQTLTQGSTLTGSNTITGTGNVTWSGFNLFTISTAGQAEVSTTVGSNYSGFTTGTAYTQYFATDGTDNSEILISSDSIQLSPDNGHLSSEFLTASTDTTNIKPVGRNPTTGRFYQMDFWRGGSGTGGEVYFGNVEPPSGYDSTIYFPTYNDDLILAMSLKLTAGAGITITKSHTDSTLNYTLGNYITTSSSTLTLSTEGVYVFTGSSGVTWTLPAVSGNTGKKYIVKNRGSANVTVQRAGSDQIYTTTAETNIIILPGDSYTFQNDGTYYIVY